MAGTEPPAATVVEPRPLTVTPITADGNIVHSTPATFLSHRTDPDSLRVRFRDRLECQYRTPCTQRLLRTAAQFKVDDILTRDVIAFQDAVRQTRHPAYRNAETRASSVEQCSVESRRPGS